MTGSVSEASLWALPNMQFSAMHLGLALLLTVIVSRLALRMYRLYMHPLKSFKGLTEACISEDWLYKVTKEGTAEAQFEELHQRLSKYSHIRVLKIRSYRGFPKVPILGLSDDMKLTRGFAERYQGSSNWTKRASYHRN